MTALGAQSLGFLALGLAILANVIANIALKQAMQSLEVDGLRSVVLGLLGSGAFWLGICSLAVLLSSYLFAIRLIPLGIAYAGVTSLTIALLTLWGMLYGAEQVGMLRLIGIAAVILGFVCIVMPTK